MSVLKKLHSSNWPDIEQFFFQKNILGFHCNTLPAPCFELKMVFWYENTILIGNSDDTSELFYSDFDIDIENIQRKTPFESLV